MNTDVQEKPVLLEQISFATTRAASGRQRLFTARYFYLCTQFNKMAKYLFTVNGKDAVNWQKKTP